MSSHDPTLHAMTHEQIAEVLGISRQAVAQAETRAFRKLRELPVLLEMLAMAREMQWSRDRDVVARQAHWKLTERGA